MDRGNRFVRARCPLCGSRSPVCDQQADVYRTVLSDWWATHSRLHLPSPVFEVAEPFGGQGGDDNER